MNAASWWRHTGIKRRRQRVSDAAALVIAGWDDTTRVQSRGHLLWLAQQLTEARRAAQAALDDPDTPLVDLSEALDFGVPAQVRALSLDRTEHLIPVVGQARHMVAQLATATVRSRRKGLAALTADLTTAADAMNLACNDVSGADLRETELSHVYLGGIRWDANTQWPAAWADRIRAGSSHSDGWYQVKDDW